MTRNPGPAASVSLVSSRPPAIRARPAITSGIRAPRAATIRPASGAQTAIVTAIGSRYSPAASGLKPRTSCRYKVLRNRNPPIAANAATALAVAPENVGKGVGDDGHRHGVQHRA